MPIHKVEFNSDSIGKAISDAEKAGETVIQVATAVDPVTLIEVALVITEKPTRNPGAARPRETR